MDLSELVRLNVLRHSGVKDQPAAPQQRDVQSLLDLVALVSDPKATAARVKQLADAAAAAASARAELAKLEQTKAQLEDELKAARKANVEAMSHDRELQQAELARRHQEHNSREQQIELRKLRSANCMLRHRA